MIDLEPGGTRISGSTKAKLRLSSRVLNFARVFLLLALIFGGVRHFLATPPVSVIIFTAGVALFGFSAASLLGLVACLIENAGRHSDGGLEPLFLYWAKGLRLGSNYRLCQAVNLIHFVLQLIMLMFGIALMLNACFGVRYPADWPGARGREISR